MTSRLILAGLVAIAAVTPIVASAAGPFHLEEATIDDIQSAIKSGEITCKGLVQAYMARIKAYNGVCTKLVTVDGASLPVAKGATRAGAPLTFPTKTVAASSFLPDINQYAGSPLEFGKMLDYRDSARVGDCKYLWETNRHLHLVTLAQAYALTAQPRFAVALREQLDSWFIACPFRMGVNWSSSLEAALRLINWSAAWHLVGGKHSRLFEGEDGEAFRQRLLVSVYQHAEFIAGHLSLHSSANNHLIGEVAGLYMAGVTWPHWPRSEQWRSRGKAILERKKVGFRVPVNKWFQGPLKGYLFDHLRARDSKTRAYYDPQVLDRVLDDHIEGRQNHEKLLWALLNLEIWHRQYA